MGNSISEIYRQRLLQKMEEKQKFPYDPNIDRDITFLLICEREAHKYNSGEEIEQVATKQLEWAEGLVGKMSEAFNGL